MMKSVHKIPALGLTGGAALEISGGTFRIITSLGDAYAVKRYWKSGEFKEVFIQPGESYDLAALYER